MRRTPLEWYILKFQFGIPYYINSLLLLWNFHYIFMFTRAVILTKLVDLDGWVNRHCVTIKAPQVSEMSSSCHWFCFLLTVWVTCLCFLLTVWGSETNGWMRARPNTCLRFVSYVTLNSRFYEVVDNFTYLGISISTTNNVRFEIQCTVALTNWCLPLD